MLLGLGFLGSGLEQLGADREEVRGDERRSTKLLGSLGTIDKSSRYAAPAEGPRGAARQDKTRAAARSALYV